MRGSGISILLAQLLYVVGIAANEAPADLSKEAVKANNQSLLWGPYRPNLYFGVRPRLPQSLLAGLMWSNVDEYSSLQSSKLRIQLGLGRQE